VSLSRRQLRTLRGIERDLVCGDPRLHEFFEYFGPHLRSGEMPRAERVTRWPSRLLGRLWRGRSVSERVADWCAENWRDP
jgi:hypothetical protein